MLHFTTFFDKNYLSRGLVLYQSLKEFESHFELYILCIDEFTLEFFVNNAVNYPEIKALSLSELENTDSELKACKTNRRKIEYYFTLSPCLPLYLLKRYGLPHICSLDADIFFLDTPESIFNHLNKYSIIITPHKFSLEMQDLVDFGIYNVSFQIFKNDDAGVKCLEYWRTQCIDWCRDEFDKENNRFADQKYLDNWTDMYPFKVKVLNDDISGIAPWNLNNYRITQKENKFYSNGERMIFYHFHHFKFFTKCWASNGLNTYSVKSRHMVGKLYLTYWNKLSRCNVSIDVKSIHSTRHEYSNNIYSRIFRENYVCFNLMNKHIFDVNFTMLPNIIKRILIKINA